MIISPHWVLWRDDLDYVKMQQASQAFTLYIHTRRMYFEMFQFSDSSNHLKSASALVVHVFMVYHSKDEIDYYHRTNNNYET